MGDPPAFGNTLRLREEARDAWGWRWLDDLVAGHALRVANAAPQPRVCADGIVTLRARSTSACSASSMASSFGPYTPVPTKWWRWTPTVHRPLEKRETSPTRTIATSRQARPASLRTWRLTQWRFRWMMAWGAAGVCRRGDRRLLPRLWHAGGGRTFTMEEERHGAGIGVAISHSLWEQLRRHAETSSRVVRINGEQFTVGVAPEGFTGRAFGPEVFLPLGAYKTFKGGTTPSLDSREAH